MRMKTKTLEMAWRRLSMAICLSAALMALVGQSAPLNDLRQGRNTLTASGPWEMAQKTAPEKWMPAVVPGTVLSTLVKNGVVPDPYWGQYDIPPKTVLYQIDIPP